jgi:hypothetical protein
MARIQIVSEPAEEIARYSVTMVSGTHHFNLVVIGSARV